MNTNTNTKSKELPENLKQFEGMTPEQVLQKLGGTARGAVSTAIRALTAMGATKGQTAALLNKRFQHVRNVLHNDAQNANRPKAAAPQATITLPQVSIQQNDKLEPTPATPAENSNQKPKSAGSGSASAPKGFAPKK